MSKLRIKRSLAKAELPLEEASSMAQLTLANLTTDGRDGRGLLFLLAIYLPENEHGGPGGVAVLTVFWDCL